MTTVPRSELERRHRAVQKRMREHDPPLDGLLVVQNADLYYLAGTIQTAHLVLPAAGEPRLLVRKVIERARADSALGDVRSLKSLKDLPTHLQEVCGAPPWRLGMELDVLPANLHRAYEKILGKDAQIADASAAVLAARAVKSDWEVERLRKAAEIHRDLFLQLPRILRDGVDITTHGLQSLLEDRARQMGHCGVIRMRGLNIETSIGIVVSGEEGAMPGHSMFPIGGKGPHPWVAQGGSFKPIQRDTPIALDFLMSRDGYHADCTRMAVLGRFPDEAAEILAKLQKILRFAEEKLRAGAVPSEIYAAVLSRAEEAGLSDGFMGAKGYQVRFVGHAVGLEVNEIPVLAPRFDEPLVPGNTLAVEPKFTHPSWGVIGLENTYLVREGSPENLTPWAEEVIDPSS